MYRLTARLLLVLLLVGTFAPAALAIAAPVQHACCMRKPMHDHGSGSREIRAVGGDQHSCCPTAISAHWAELGSGVHSSTHPLLAYLSPDPHQVSDSSPANALQPVRGPPLS